MGVWLNVLSLLSWEKKKKKLSVVAFVLSALILSVAVLILFSGCLIIQINNEDSCALFLVTVPLN